MLKKDQLKKAFETEDIFNVENWYESLKEFTFKTDFLPLSIEEAICLVQRYRRDITKKSGKLHVENEEEVLQNLQNRLEIKIKEMGKCFIRLSTRSPKDAVLELDESQKFIESQIKNYISSLQDIKERFLNIWPSWDEEGNEVVNNDDLLSELTNEEYNGLLKIIFNSTKELLQIDCSKKAITVLTRSLRVCQDLKKLLLCQDIDLNDEIENKLTDDIRKQEICLISFRQWEKGLSDEFEFRCFYNNKRLTAISQYNYYFFEIELQSADIQSIIQSEIVKIFELIKDKLPSASGVIDFAVFYKEKPPKTIMVELNPFNDYENAGTSGCMFCWVRDLEQLKNGENIEFRVLKQPKNNIVKEVIPFISVEMKSMIANIIYEIKESFYQM